MKNVRQMMCSFSACFVVFSLIVPAFASDHYKLGPDSMPQQGVPKGEVTQYSWTTSKIFPGTVRDYWVYVPAQYDPAKPTCVMVFHDGGGFQRADGPYRVPVVFDNLIHKKEMPVTIGIFVNPGVVPARGADQHARKNRSFEYDTLSDRYARFLLEEILPEVGKKYNLTQDPSERAVCGSSSGGICALTAAWQRPDAFRRVISFNGAYMDTVPGIPFSSLIRRVEPKPLRIFQQAGSNDLDVFDGHFFLDNQNVAAALKWTNYDHQFVIGDGGHNPKHGGSILPDALRWIWRDYPAPIRTAVSTPQPVMDILIPGEEWQLVAEGFKFTEGPATDAAGNVFFTDIPNNRIHKIDGDRKVSVFKEDTGGANGLMFGPDGKLYACQNGRKRIVAYGPDGRESVIAEEVESNDLVVSNQGTIYFTDPRNKQVWFISAQGEKRVVDTGIAFPNGILLTPDQSLLVVADTRGRDLFSLQITSNGSLEAKQRYYGMYIPDGEIDSGADGMTVDTKGRIYVTSRFGLHVFDQMGRVVGFISKPENKWLSNVVFGGKELDLLFVTCEDKVYSRKTKARGVLFFQNPVVTPKPCC